MSETTLDLEQNQPKKRPVFLTVLCILTWIGSGITVLSGLFSLIALESIKTNYYTLQDAPGMNWGEVTLENYVFWSSVSNIVGLISGIACVLGALLMWKLNKTGFYLYIFGSVIAVVVSFISMKALMPVELAWVGIITAALSALLAIAFIIMYGVNLKHMK